MEELHEHLLHEHNAPVDMLTGPTAYKAEVLARLHVDIHDDIHDDDRRLTPDSHVVTF